MSTQHLDERRDTRKFWLVGGVLVAGMVYPLLGVLAGIVAAVSLRHTRFQVVLWALALAWLLFATIFGVIGAQGGGGGARG
jgi:cation transporter-like permease